MKSHTGDLFFGEEWFKTLNSNDVQGSLQDRLTMILEYVGENPSLKDSPQYFEFKNGNQPFTLKVEFSNDGIKCEYRDGTPYQRAAAGPIKEAVKETFKTELVSIIGEQARRNVLGEFGVFHHAKHPSQQTPANQNQQSEATSPPMQRKRSSSGFGN